MHGRSRTVCQWEFTSHTHGVAAKVLPEFELALVSDESEAVRVALANLLEEALGAWR